MSSCQGIMCWNEKYFAFTILVKLNNFVLSDLFFKYYLNWWSLVIPGTYKLNIVFDTVPTSFKTVVVELSGNTLLEGVYIRVT